MARDLCPRCGAYWRCDCQLEELSLPAVAGCDHDWIDAVGVALDFEAVSEDSRVVVCRHCGLYAIAPPSHSAPGNLARGQ
jgi:hypothetical protein